MNSALSDAFLANLLKAMCEMYEPIRMKQLNTVFFHMFDWFIMKYERTMTKDCKANWQRMAGTWHPSSIFEPLTMYLFIGASYTSMACYPKDNCNIINISLRIITCCGMYTDEYQYWIFCKNEVPPIVKTIDSFKEYWADVIALINQTAVLASQYGYDMTAVDDDPSVGLYGDSLANFGASYAVTQETMKS
jgi:hypothetical protein